MLIDIVIELLFPGIITNWGINFIIYTTNQTNKLNKLAEQYLLNVLNFIFSVEENYNRITLMGEITTAKMREACCAIHVFDLQVYLLEIL